MDTNQIIDLIQAYVVPLIYAIIILFVGRIVARFVRDTFRKVLGKRNVEPAVVSFTSNVLYFLLLDSELELCNLLRGFGFVVAVAQVVREVAP